MKLGLTVVALASVAVMSIFLMGAWKMQRQLVGAIVVAVICGIGLVQTEHIVSAFDRSLYEDQIILTEETPYQKIVVTRFGERTRLFLNNAIQFDSQDEHRYHEALVHPAMGLMPSARRVLVLGGGDGMAVREVLKHASVLKLK